MNSIFFKAIIAALILLSPVISLYSKKSNFILDQTVPNNLKEAGVKIQADFPVGPDGRPLYEDTLLTHNGNFKIHYWITTSDGVGLLDENNNNVPDYVDSIGFYFEYVYDLYVNQLGYIDPVHPYMDHYDVYVVDFGNYVDNENFFFTGGYYGVTYSDGKMPNGSSIGAYKSFILIDNNFSPDDMAKSSKDAPPRRAYYTTGYDGMKVTVAHEFHHAIHFAYGQAEHSAAVAEMTSVLMEEYVFPEINDYFQYIPDFYNSAYEYNLSSDAGRSGYRWALFFMMLEKRYDVTLIRDSWKNSYYEGNEYYTTLDKLIRERSNGESSIGAEMKEFIEWLYYTGKRAAQRDERERFSDAAYFPEIMGEYKEIYDPPSYISEGSLKPYEFRPSRIIFESGDFTGNDTLDIILADTSRGWFTVPHFTLKEYSLVLSDGKQPGMEKLDRIDNYYKFENDGNIVYFLKTYPGGSTVAINHGFPNPLNLNSGEALNLPVPENAPLYAKLPVAIYSSDMHQIRSELLPVQSVNNKRVARFENTAGFLTSGVYFYSAEFDGRKVFGKFAVIRK